MSLKEPQLAGQFILSLMIITLVMLAGAYNSLRSQQQLIEAYKIDLPPTTNNQNQSSEQNFQQYYYQQAIFNYNAGLKKFPNSIVATVLDMKPKSLD